MRNEESVQAEYENLRAKLEAAFQQKARSPQGSPAWAEAEREIGRLSHLGAALGWVLGRIGDVEEPHYPLPERTFNDAPVPLGQFWRDQLGDLAI